MIDDLHSAATCFDLELRRCIKQIKCSGESGERLA